MAATELSTDARQVGAVYKETVVGLNANLDLMGGAGKLVALNIVNSAGNPTYVKLYDARNVASAGTDAPWMAFKIAASTTRLIVFQVANGLAFSQELAMRASNAAMVSSGNDGSAPAANCTITVYMRS